MFITMCEWIAELSIIIPLVLILIGSISFIIIRRVSIKQIEVVTVSGYDPDFPDRKRKQPHRPLLLTVSLYVGIVVGILGIFIILIQIGVFFGWWPEKIV